MGMAIDTGVANCQVALTLQVALSCLYGFFLVEAQAYFSRFPKDRLAFKLLVLWLLGLQTFYYGVRFAVRPSLSPSFPPRFAETPFSAGRFPFRQ